MRKTWCPYCNISNSASAECISYEKTSRGFTQRLFARCTVCGKAFKFSRKYIKVSDYYNFEPVEDKENEE